MGMRPVPLLLMSSLGLPTDNYETVISGTGFAHSTHNALDMNFKRSEANVAKIV